MNNTGQILLSYISFYQLDNLIQSRIPFMFLNMAEDISGWYHSVAKMHVDNHQILLKPEDVLQVLVDKAIPKEFAIVLLCPDGKTSEKVHAVLEKNNYTNVYLVQGGFKQLVTDRG